MRVALVTTGGTIGCIGSGPFDVIDYGATGQVVDAEGLLDFYPELRSLADIRAVSFRNVPSFNVYLPEWRELVELADQLVRDDPGLDGIVITHGTGSLEETAYVLSLTIKVDVPVVLVGAQRPPSAVSSDAGMNLANAIRVATSPDARGLGVLVVMNDEIHAAREVMKTSTFRLQAFQSPDFGLLGHADADRVSFYRRPLRCCAPDTEFEIRGLATLPRVDVLYSYTGSDGTAARAFVEAGARGVVVAGFAPGFCGEADAAVLAAAVRERGLVVAQSTRAGSGRVSRTQRLSQGGFVAADNLSPQKARLLLALALTRTSDPAGIERIFASY